MAMKLELIKDEFLDLVSIYKNVLFNNIERNHVKKKQDAWKFIHAKMVSRKLVSSIKDWKWTRAQWYYLTHLARKSQEQFLLGRICDIPEFDKKLLKISGIFIQPNKEVSNAVDRLNMENQVQVEMLTPRDHFEIIEHKLVSPFPETEEDVKPNELLNKMEIDFLERKVNEQRFQIQQYKLLKRRLEINNIKNKKEREAFMKLL